MDIKLNSKITDIQNRLINIYNNDAPPKAACFFLMVKMINQILESEPDPVRPYSLQGLPGGLVNLKNDISTIIIPDLHARKDFLLQILLNRDNNNESLITKMSRNEAQLVCVGDGMHSEYRTGERWNLAYNEFKGNYSKHHHMDMEMGESFGLMEMVMYIKQQFPENFHFLKGNHENITNEEGNGNHPFIKFALEGPMVLRYVTNFYGEEFLKEYERFEKNLPLFAVGSDFLISHAEPSIFLNRDEIINYRKRPKVVYALTWTDDDVAEEGSVESMLRYYLERESLEDCYYFGGHRIVSKMYNLRANNKYVQIHNPQKYIYVLIKPGKKINIEEDIKEI